MTTLTELKTLADGSTLLQDEGLPNVRYTVMPDYDTESPARWGSFDVYVYASARGFTTDEGRADESQISQVFFNILDATRNDETALDAARRFAVIYLDYSREQAEQSILTYSARGYSQGDWWDILVIDERDVYAGHAAETWEQWARGDVHYVYAEQLIACEIAGCHGELEAHWSRELAEDEGLYGLGGIYADSPEAAVAEFLRQ